MSKMRTHEQEIQIEDAIVEFLISECPMLIITQERLLLEVNDWEETLEVTSDEIPHALQSLVDQKRLERVVAYRLPE